MEKLKEVEEKIRNEEQNINSMFDTDLGDDFGGGQYS